MTTASRARTWGIGVIGAATLAAAAWGMTHAMPVQKAAAADGTTAISASQAATISPVFAAAQTPDDKLPAYLVSGPQQLDGVVATSSRLLGQDNGAKVWATLSTDGKACVVSLMPGADEYATMSCSTPATFATQGIGIQAKNAGKTSRVFFIPQGFGPSGGLRSAGTQLLAGDATVAQTSGTTLTRTGATVRIAGVSAAPSSITLPAFPSIDSGE